MLLNDRDALGPRSWFCERTPGREEQWNTTALSTCCWRPMATRVPAFRHVLIEFGRTCWPTHLSLIQTGAPRPDTKRLAAQFLALPRSFDEFSMPADFLTKFYLTLPTLYFMGKQSGHLTGCAKNSLVSAVLTGILGLGACLPRRAFSASWSWPSQSRSRSAKRRCITATGASTHLEQLNRKLTPAAAL